MRKALFDELVQSVEEMKAIRNGTLKAVRVTTREDILQRALPDVAALRRRFKLSQSKFAALLGISVNTLQNWEQGRRSPEGPARVLLRIALTHPEALLDTQRPVSRTKRGRSAA
jgi:putative transcriptional regulator